MEKAYLMNILLMVKNDRISVEEGFRLINGSDAENGTKRRSRPVKMVRGFGMAEHPETMEMFLRMTRVNGNFR